MISLFILQAILVSPPVDPQAVLAQATQAATAAASQRASEVAATKAAEVAAANAPDLSSYAKKTEIPDITPLAKKTEIPAPAMAVGQAEMVGGAVGSSMMTYKRGDWVPPRISRTARCVLTTSSVCTATWEGGAFPSGTTLRLIGDPAPINPSGPMPIQCNATAMTVTTITIRCWLGLAPVVNILGGTLNPFGYAAAGTEVQVSAIPSS